MSWKRDIAVVAGLICLGCLVQVVLISRTAVPGLDAVRFIEVARLMESRGVIETIRGQSEQPLFPVCVWLVHEGLERTIGPFRSSWVTAAQIASAAALVLAVVPVYFLSVRLVGRAAALAGALLFCVLPEVSRLGAEGISDSTHLLCFSLAFWAAVAYFTIPPTCPAGSTRWNPWLLAAGATIGLGALVRAEVLVLMAVLVVAILAFQFQASQRQSWARVAAACGCLGLGFALVFGPYLAVSGSLAPGAAMDRLLGRYEPADEKEPPALSAPVTSADGQPLSFAQKEPTISLRRRGYPAAIAQFAEELADAFGYWVAAFAVFGVWRLRSVLTRPVDRFAQAFLVLFSLAAIHFTASEGYLSARHLVPLVVVGIGCTGQGLLETGRWITAFGRIDRRKRTEPACREPIRAADVPLAWTVLLPVMIACLVEGQRPLGADHLEYRRAAQWLASQVDMPGAVLDTRGWTGLYSGRPTYRYDDARTAFALSDLAYVVLEQRELGFESDRSRTLRRILNAAAEPVATFVNREDKAGGRRTVVVYQWSAERFSRWAGGRPDDQPTREERHVQARPRVHPERG